MTMAPRPSVRAAAARGAVVTGIAQAYKIGISFVSGVLVARLLTPADFGLVAMASSCVALVSLIQDLGLNQATIQREKLSQGQMSALFWLSLVTSFFLAGLLALCAPAVAWFFGDARLTGVTVAFAFLILLGGSQSQPFAILNRELRFVTLAGLDVLSATVSAVAGVTVAWLTSSYWALLAGSLASGLTGIVCVWILCNFKPGRPSFEGDFKEIFRFGTGLSGFNILSYLARNADNVLIGRFYGAEQLGLYDRAYRLLLFPLMQIQTPLGRVMLPLLARLQSDPERYRTAFTECMSLLMMAVQPGLMLVVVFADDVFLILLGPHWVPAAPIFRWLGVAGLLQAMLMTGAWLLLSQARGGHLFKLGLFIATTTVTSFLIGLPWGPLGVAKSYAITNYIIVAPVVWWLGRRGPVSTRDIVVTALPHIASTAVSGIILVGIWLVLPSPNALMCFGLAVVSYVGYGLVLVAFPAKRLLLGKNLRAFVGIFRRTDITGDNSTG